MIFSSADVTSSIDDYHQATERFREVYGFDHQGVGVAGFDSYDEVAAYDQEMAEDADLICVWDCWLFLEEGVCTFDEYMAACKDGTVMKFYR